MPRFVLLYHDCPPDFERPSHWDLMLESGSALRTWSLARLPKAWGQHRDRTAEPYSNCPPLSNENSVPAEQLADHRLDYLTFEGSLSGNRGQAICIERGNFTTGAESDRFWQVTLAGPICNGRVTLQQSAADTRRWTLTVYQPED
jgi:hypothetical protein